MRQIVLAVREELRSVLDSTIFRIGARPDQGDIFISEEVNYLPESVGLPAVGVKDGSDAILRRYACGEGKIVEEHESTIQVICWTPSDSTFVGGGVIGDTTQPGVLDISEMIHDILYDNLILDNVHGVERGYIPGSGISDQGGRIVQNLIIPYTYKHEIKRDARLLHA